MKGRENIFRAPTLYYVSLYNGPVVAWNITLRMGANQSTSSTPDAKIFHNDTPISVRLASYNCIMPDY